jgi:hypothetical protein
MADFSFGTLGRTGPTEERTMTKTERTRAEDFEQTSSVDPHPTWRPTAERSEAAAPHHRIVELPPLGYPIGEEAVTHWFEQTFSRKPESAEVGVILDAMARRDAKQPASEASADQVFRDRSPAGGE